MFDVTTVKVPEGYYLQVNVWPSGDTVNFILIEGVSPVAMLSLRREQLDAMQDGGQAVVDDLWQQARQLSVSREAQRQWLGQTGGRLGGASTSMAIDDEPYDVRKIYFRWLQSLPPWARRDLERLDGKRELPKP